MQQSGPKSRRGPVTLSKYRKGPKCRRVPCVDHTVVMWTKVHTVNIPIVPVPDGLFLAFPIFRHLCDNSKQIPGKKLGCDKNPKCCPSIIDPSDASSENATSGPVPLLPRFYCRATRQKNNSEIPTFM
jgi:hypothetical protein